MNEPVEMTEAPPVPAPEAADLPPPDLAPEPAPQAVPLGATPTLEARVRALEESVAVLQDTRKVEDRIAERVARRIERKQAGSAIKGSATALAGAGAAMLPAAVTALQAQAAAVEAQLRAEATLAPQPGLLADLYAEVRSMLRMYLDRRYRLPWKAKVLPPVILGVMVLLAVWLYFMTPTWLGWPLDKVLELVLAFVLYKVLSREAHHYREVSAQLPPVP